MEKAVGGRCDYCSKEFSKLSNCRRHMRNIHEKKPDDEDNNSYVCVFCNKRYTQKSGLQRHVETVHVPDSTKAYYCDKCTFKTLHPTSLKRHLLLHENGKEENYFKKISSKAFKCSFCSAQFNDSRNLNFHERKIHNMDTPSRNAIKRKCPICKYIATGSGAEESIHNHFQTVHSIEINSENLQFDSLETFYGWKKDTEKKTGSFFRKVQSTPSEVLYRCHRSGTYKKCGSNRRHLKVVGSCKINAFCPAVLKVKMLENNSVIVLYISSHVGHKNDLKHLLPKRHFKEEKDHFDVEIDCKLSSDENTKIVKTTGLRGSLQKQYYVNRSGILYIEKNVDLKSELIKHPFDPVNIETLVQEMKLSQDTTVLAYKPQGVVSSEFSQLRKDDFLLIIMTQAQMDNLNKYSHDVIYIDGTHGLNSSNFQLYTLLVLDECREGFPSAFMFTNRGDETVLAVFFEQLRKLTGLIKPNAFMSDMEEGFYSAWVKVMGPPTIQLYCTWHVLKDWRTNIDFKIKKYEAQEKVYKMLRTLLYELNEDLFNEMLSEALAMLSNDEETQLFHDYFEKQYVSEEKYKCWAHCYRVNAGINTNMAMENYNKLLKHCCLKGDTVKELGKTLCAILNLLKDKLFDLIVKLEKSTLFQRLLTMRKRHRQSLALDAEKVLLKLSEDEWQILSSGKPEHYLVRRVGVCKKCQLICIHCSSCFHQFVCSCVDNSILHNMCKHVHLVCRTMNCGNLSPEPAKSDTDYTVPESLEEDYNIDGSLLPQYFGNTSIDDEKKKLLEEVRGIERSLETLETIEEVVAARNYLQQLLPTVKAAKENYHSNK